MLWNFPIAVASAAETIISIRRIEVELNSLTFFILDHLIKSLKQLYHIQLQNFLLLGEVTNIPGNTSSEATLAQHQVNFENVSTKWPVNSTKTIDNDDDNH